MVKSFSDCELSGREKYERNTHLPHEFMGQNDPWDVSSSAILETYNIEIKDRDILYTKYARQGYWLEKFKYDALMAAYIETGSIPIYLNFFRNNVGYYWDLRNAEPKWVWKEATKTTANGTYGEEKVWKLVTFLYPIEGRRFKYV